MQRREFCKLIAAATAAKAIPAIGQSGAASTVPVPAPNGFNTLHQSYEEFCATPEEQRVFYALVDGRIVEQKLDNATWELPVRGPGMRRRPSTPAGFWNDVPLEAPVSGLSGEGPYKPDWDSMLQYEAPEWYRDAKFGIWAHWSPQCVPEDGDWYARNLYVQGSKQNQFQLEHYGPPSQAGYKELCLQWTLLNWDPEALIQRYKDTGARLFIALANHHDSFDTWNSKHHSWNAANLGPHRDVIGEWAAAARKQGMRMGVTVHQARNWSWFQTSHAADKTGVLAGVPYDGRLTAAEGKEQWWHGFDPQQLYGPKHPIDALPDVSYVKNFYDRTRDLIDQHDPDLLYFDDNLLPLGWGGMNIGAYFYNHNLQTHGGKMEAVLNIKNVPDHLAKAAVADYEAGLTSGIMPYVWQSETCLGDWHYQRALYEEEGEYGGYLPPRDVIHWLIDTVSKNGTFILNVPGMPDGTIDSKEIAILDQIAAWMKINSEAIYETRPWKVYGEGPNKIQTGAYQARASLGKLGATDIRFTSNKANNVIYAITLGWPEGEVEITSLGTGSKTAPGKVQHVEMLGAGARIKWRQSAESLKVTMPARPVPASQYGAALKVSLA